MNYNLEKAFCFVKDDSGWIKKILTGGLLIIVSYITLLLVLGITIATKKMCVWIFLLWLLGFFIFGILNLCVYGFSICYGRNLIGQEHTSLPEWKNFKTFILLGLKAVLGSFLYYVPMFILSALFIGADIFIRISGIDTSGEVFRIYTFVSDCIYQLVSLLYIIFFFIFNAIFLKECRVLSFVNIPKAFNWLKDNKKNYCLLVLFILAIGVFLNILIFLLALTIIGIIFIPFVVIYIQIVITDLIAQYVNTLESYDKE